MKSRRSSNRLPSASQPDRRSRQNANNPARNTGTEDLVCVVVQRYVADLMAARDGHTSR